MIKYILALILIIPLVLYEAWNQKKNREAEWYFHDFRNKVLSFLTELRTEPENTRRMLRKLAFDDTETQLKNYLLDLRHKYNEETSKDYKDRDRDRICNLAGKIDGINYAIERLNANKPKSYKKCDEQSDPMLPEEIQTVYKSAVEELWKENK